MPAKSLKQGSLSVRNTVNKSRNASVPIFYSILSNHSTTLTEFGRFIISIIVNCKLGKESVKIDLESFLMEPRKSSCHT